MNVIAELNITTENYTWMYRRKWNYKQIEILLEIKHTKIRSLRTRYILKQNIITIPTT